jgi:hypothetical protein
MDQQPEVKASKHGTIIGGRIGFSSPRDGHVVFEKDYLFFVQIRWRRKKKEGEFCCDGRRGLWTMHGVEERTSMCERESRVWMG